MRNLVETHQKSDEKSQKKFEKCVKTYIKYDKNC